MRIGIATGDFVNDSVREDGTQILGGSGHIRIGQYLPYSNHDYVIGELAWDPSINEFAIREFGNEPEDLTYGFDLLIMQRWMHKTIPQQIKTVQKKGMVVVNDLDDWYWGLDQNNLAFYGSHPRVNPDENINHYKKTLATSDHVIVSTPYLADRLTQWIKPDRIHLMENHVELDKFKQREHTEKAKPVIGWMGSTRHRAGGDLDILKSLYNALGTQDWGYHHSGHVGWYDHFYDVVGLGKDDVTILVPMPPERLTELMVFDIGVVPLRITPFNQAKSWIKGIEYTAAGIPFVASPSDEYKRLNKKYGIGRLAKNQNAWLKHMAELRNPGLRQEEADRQLAALEALDVRYGAAKWDGMIASFL